MAVVVFLVVAKSSGIQVATECSTLWSVLKFVLMQTSKIFVLWNLPLWASHTLDGFEDVSLAPLSSLTDKGAQSLEGNCGQGRKVALLLCPARSACSTSAKVQACAQKKTEERKDKETKIGRGPGNSFVKVLVVTSRKMIWKLLARIGFEAMKQFLTIVQENPAGNLASIFNASWNKQKMPIGNPIRCTLLNICGQVTRLPQQRNIMRQEGGECKIVHFVQALHKSETLLKMLCSILVNSLVRKWTEEKRVQSPVNHIAEAECTGDMAKPAWG